MIENYHTPLNSTSPGVEFVAFFGQAMVCSSFPVSLDNSISQQQGNHPHPRQANRVRGRAIQSNHTRSNATSSVWNTRSLPTDNDPRFLFNAFEKVQGHNSKEIIHIYTRQIAFVAVRYRVTTRVRTRLARCGILAVFQQTMILDSFSTRSKKFKVTTARKSSTSTPGKSRPWPCDTE